MKDFAKTAGKEQRLPSISPNRWEFFIANLMILLLVNKKTSQKRLLLIAQHVADLHLKEILA